MIENIQTSSCTASRRQWWITHRTSKKVFPIITELIGDNTIVCHNRGADIPILESCMKHYRLSGIDIDNNLCTYELAGKSLVDACEEYNINMGCHHNALDDARACANVLLAHSGKIFADVFVMDRKHIAEKKWLTSKVWGE